MPVFGSQQSPIRIVHTDTIRASLSGDLKFGYDRALPGKFKDDNFIFDVALLADKSENTAGKTITAGGKDWVIRKIHIHSPAEHLIDDDDPSDFECHLVHTLPGDVRGRGAKLVVGVFFAISKKPPKSAKQRKTLYGLNEKMRSVHRSDTAKKPGVSEHAHDINPSDFLPEDRLLSKFYRYEGSLTSEPFSEDVSWYVLQPHALVHAGSVDQIAVCAEQEARPAHALDRRFVLRSF